MCSSPTSVHIVPYDIDSYSKNFDDGYYSSDPDNASRTFSARFAYHYYSNKLIANKVCDVSSDDEDSMEMSS